MGDSGNIIDEMSCRILVLDGAMATMLQRIGMTEKDFRGTRLAGHPVGLDGNYDILCLTCPDVVRDIYRQYLEAGADIISTNTFNATVIEQSRYVTGRLIEDINFVAARMAREEADRYSVCGWQRFVAGVMGAGGLSLSRIGPDGFAMAFGRMAMAYESQASSLIAGGVDMLLIETVYDLQNCRAAMTGAWNAVAECGRDVPISVSFAITDDGLSADCRIVRILDAVGDFAPFAVGFNCCAVTERTLSMVRRISERSPYPVIFYPNAGLPDADGVYPQTSVALAESVAPLVVDGSVRIIGGCCGSTPEYIRALRRSVLPKL